MRSENWEFNADTSFLCMAFSRSLKVITHSTTSEMSEHPFEFLENVIKRLTMCNNILMHDRGPGTALIIGALEPILQGLELTELMLEKHEKHTETGRAYFMKIRDHEDAIHKYNFLPQEELKNKIGELKTDIHSMEQCASDEINFVAQWAYLLNQFITFFERWSEFTKGTVNISSEDKRALIGKYLVLCPIVSRKVIPIVISQLRPIFRDKKLPSEPIHVTFLPKPE